MSDNSIIIFLKKLYDKGKSSTLPVQELEAEYNGQHLLHKDHHLSPAENAIRMVRICWRRQSQWLCRKNSNPYLPLQPIPALFCRLVQLLSCRLLQPGKQIFREILLQFLPQTLQRLALCQTSLFGPDRQSWGSNSLLVKFSNLACPLSTKRRLKLGAARGWP